jgi:hypothetical protein
MRALIVSTAHPNDVTIFDRWVRPLADDGWDVVYVAPFADYGARPPARLTGMDIPVDGSLRRTLQAAASVFRFRGPEADVVIVSSDRLAALAHQELASPIWVARAGGPNPAGALDIDELLRRPGGAPAGSSAIQCANGSDAGDPDRSATPRQGHGTMLPAQWRAGS